MLGPFKFGALALGLASLPIREGIAFNRAYCSLVPLWSLQDPNATRMIVRGTADSVPSGDASLSRTSVEPPPPAYSQVFRVERLSAVAPPSVREAVRNAGNRVAIVPWSVHPDCTDAPWGGSTLWVEPGELGLMSLPLRPRDKWLNGIPTFDRRRDYYGPYPKDAPYRRSNNLPSLRILTPDELLSFYDSIPAIQVNRDNKAEQFRLLEPRRKAIISWARDHPDIATHYRVGEIVERAMREGELAQFDTLRSPLAGTYRFKVRLADGDSIEFYARTTSRPTSLLFHERPSEPNDRKGAPVGYYLVFAAANDIPDLAAKPQVATGYLPASFNPVSANAESITFKSGFEFTTAAIALSRDSTFKSKLRDLSRLIMSDLPNQRESYMPGTAIRYRDGRVQIRSTVTRNGRVIAESVGVRISNEMMEN